MKKFIIASLFFLLTGCAGHQRESNQLANQLQQHPPEEVLQQLQATDPPERDFAKYHLNIGLLQLLSGDFPDAITTLTKAKKEMAVLEATSISETAGAGTINETLRSYSGYPTDRVMVHNILALSYLFNNDIDGARVEMLQADVSMKKLYKSKSLNGQLANTHLLAGIIYEMLDEQSNALISYKYSEEIILKRKLPVPMGLKKALLRMSYVVDRNGQYATYKKRYSGFPTPVNNGKKQVFAIYFDGIVSNKVEEAVMVPSHDREQLIRIAMPAYPRDKYRMARAKISDGQHNVSTDLVENINVAVREDLSAEYPSILLLTTTRAIAKYELVDQAHTQGSVFGVLVNIATALTEVADLRSWNMLPATVQFGYIETDQNEVNVNRVSSSSEKIELNNDKMHLLLISSLDTPVFHYQQAK